MNWLTGGPHTEAKKLIGQLTDLGKRERAAQDLIRLGAEAVPALVETLQARDPSLPPLAGQILVRIGSAATPGLIQALQTAHPLVRAQAADLLAQTKDRAALPALLDAVRGEFYTVRARAALALGNIGDARVLPNLLPLLKDKDDEVRSAACIAIAKFCDPSTFDDIASLLLDDLKIEVRQSAARALGETHHTAAMPYLLEALHDSIWWYEREQAARDLLAAIQKMGPAAVEPLIAALYDREGTVRKFAASLLGEMGDTRAIEPLGMLIYDLHHEVGEAAAESLAHFGGASFDVLSEALAHPEAGIREHAVAVLGKIQDARVAPVLIKMLGDPDSLIQKTAIHALAAQRDPRAVAALREVAANRADRELAALARELLLKTSSSL
jgi:HEAT repeat protein